MGGCGCYTQMWVWPTSSQVARVEEWGLLLWLQSLDILIPGQHLCGKSQRGRVSVWYIIVANINTYTGTIVSISISSVSCINLAININTICISLHQHYYLHQNQYCSKVSVLPSIDLTCCALFTLALQTTSLATSSTTKNSPSHFTTILALQKEHLTSCTQTRYHGDVQVSNNHQPTRAVILVLESIPIIGVSIIANYWIIGSMKF